MTANPLRNEVDITLGGKTYTMRATFEAMCDIEQTLGKPWSSFMFMLRDGHLGFREASVIVHKGLLGNGDEALTQKEVGECILNAGLSAILEPLMKFISIGFDGTKPLGKPGSTPEA